MSTGRPKRFSSSEAKRRAAGLSAPGVPSALYGSPTTRSRGCTARTVRSMEPQSGPLCRTAMAGRGAAVQVSVSPAASPIRLRPKSKARTVWTGGVGGSAPSSMPGHETQAINVDSHQPPRAEPPFFERQLEHDARVDRHRQPGVFAHLALELSGLPTRIPEGDERIHATLAAPHRGQHVP